MIGVKQIHISKEEERELEERYEKEQARLKAEREAENQARLDIILPKTQRLFRNRSKIGIALKRFIKKNLDSKNFIDHETIFLLRVESKQNGKRFNAVINFRPEWNKNSQYIFYVDRHVPWIRGCQTMSSRWTGPNNLMWKINNHYKIIEIYPF